MKNKEILTQLVSSYLEQEEKDTNKKASYMLERGKYHLREAYLFMLAVGDKNGHVTQDIPESVVEKATDMAFKLDKLHKSI